MSRSSAAHKQLHALFAAHHDWCCAEFPEFAVAHGDFSRAHETTDQSMAAIERRHAATEARLAELRAMPRDKLDADDQLNRDLFEWSLAFDVEGHAHRDYLPQLSGRSGPHQHVASMHEATRFQCEEDYADYLTRLEQSPRFMDDVIALLRIALAEGNVQPRVAVETLPEQLADLLDREQLRVIRSPLENARGLSEAARTALLQRFDEKTYPAARQALTHFRDFFMSEYLPRSRDSIAIVDRPGGREFYEFELRRFTTTDLSPEAIHEIGLNEVRRIRAEMMDVIRSSDFFEHNPDAPRDDDQALFQAFVAYLRTAPRFYHTSADDLVSEYRDICKRVDGQLPKLFGVLPRCPYGVRPIPEYNAPGQTTAYYFHGNMKLGRAGFFCVNTYALDQRPRYEMTALAMHEAVPGHHLQCAIAQELPDVPQFRRHLWINAFGEGWALYAERLGLEIGMYDNPYDNFGRLLYEMWRACRLVVDPGMHALGWSREQAVQFMRDNSALSEHNINSEIDRYIAWPGQAVSYKLGEIKVRELRASAEQRLGDRFDLSAFHDMLIGAGSIPLNILENRVNDWIAEHTATDA